MSAKKRSPAADYLVYLAVRILVCILQALSPRAAAAFARFLAWVVYKVNKRHRLVAIENLQKAFPGRYSDAEIDGIVRQTYLHFCTLLMEIVQVPRRFHLHNYKKFVVMRAPMKLVDLL